MKIQNIWRVLHLYDLDKIQPQIHADLEKRRNGERFPHYWELSVGSCHAATILRADDPLSRAGMNGAGSKGDGMDMEAFAKMPEEERSAMLEKMAEMFTRPNTNPRDVLAQTARKAKEEAGDYPLYYTEWNVGHYDVSYAAAGVTATLAYNEGLVEGYSYWCISDIFEEMGLHGLPFNNEFGLVNVYGTPKPVYRLFQALHEAGTKRLSVGGEEAGRTAEVLALADGKEVMLFAYNHDIEERDIKEEDMEIRLQGCIRSVKKAVIDADTTAPRLTFTAKSESVTIFKITLA